MYLAKKYYGKIMIHFIMVWQFIFAVVAGSSDVNFKVSDKREERYTLKLKWLKF